MASSQGLQIGIVGAGVAGLSAAIALRKIGHNVEVSSIHYSCKALPEGWQNIIHHLI